MKVKYLTISAALLASGTMSLVAYRSFGPVRVPDAKTLEAAGIAKVVSSDNFSRLSQEEKVKYLENAGSSDPEKRKEVFASVEKLSGPEKQKFFENMRPIHEKMMLKKVDEYLALSPEGKQEFLDQEIERMQAMGGPGGKGGRPPPKPDVQHLKNMFEKEDPVTRAKMHQFFKDVHQRMEQRKQSG